ncbi:MAG: FMN-binding negative transcriptional regulator [Alphaproteobacteria bacterium]|nr:FMN-binding negative transcriptional regulator [Alphaproteobacteria bacterium]
MHPSPAYRSPSAADDLAFVRQRAFGILCLARDAEVLTAHVPFVLDDDGLTAGFHLARSNPILTVLTEPHAALLSVQGPDGYVSPTAYGLPAQVPTWNYVAVNLRGRLQRLPDAALPGHLADLAALLEASRAPVPPWTLDDLPDARREALQRGIVPVRLTIDAVESTWKLGQGKPPAAIRGAADAVDAGPWGAERADLARRMRALAGTGEEGG